MKQYWDYQILHLPNRFKKKTSRPLDYILKSMASLSALFRHHPQILWVQLPPSPLLHLAMFYKLLFNRKLRIIADVHNSALRPQWIGFPGTLKLLNRIDAVLAHNFKVKEELIALGVQPQRVFILEDLPCDFSQQSENIQDTPYVLFPCSFDIDEPIEVVLEAARQLPAVDFMITGKHQGKLSSAVMSSAPANVKFTGFLSNADFERLLCNANAVLGLTTRANVQLSVANEAVSAGRPMALSDTPVLRDLFEEAAEFVQTLDPISIKDGLSRLIADPEMYEGKSSQLKTKRIARWKDQAERLKQAVAI